MYGTRKFLARFREYARRRKLLEEHGKVIAAVSGGWIRSSSWICLPVSAASLA